MQDLNNYETVRLPLEVLVNYEKVNEVDKKANSLRRKFKKNTSKKGYFGRLFSVVVFAGISIFGIYYAVLGREQTKIKPKEGRTLESFVVQPQGDLYGEEELRANYHREGQSKFHRSSENKTENYIFQDSKMKNYIETEDYKSSRTSLGEHIAREELVEKYAFEGEQISWVVSVMDKNKINEVSEVNATDLSNGNDVEVNCVRD